MHQGRVAYFCYIINIIVAIFLLASFSHQQGVWFTQQVPSVLQDSPQYYCQSQQYYCLNDLDLSSDFQFFQSPFQAFEDRFKYTN